MKLTLPASRTLAAACRGLLLKLAALAALSSPFAHGAPFSNGSFESPGMTAGTTTVDVSNGTVGPWTVTGTEVYYDKVGNIHGWTPYNGQYGVNLGARSSTGATLTQDFDTVAGEVYSVSCRVLQVGRAEAQGQAVSIQAFNGQTSLAAASVTTIPSNGRYERATYTFQAASTTTRLVIKDSTNGGGETDWCLDQVEVVAGDLPKAQPGELDPGFGVSGVVTTSVLGPARDVAFDSLGRLVVVSEALNGDFRIARFLPNGTADAGFGGTGSVELPLSGSALSYGVSVDSTDRIVVAGNSSFNGSYPITVVRLKPDGAFDETFGNGTGIVRVPVLRFDCAYSIAHQSDGRIVLVGEGANGGSYVAVVCLKPDGTLDDTFGNSGITRTDIGDPGAGNDRGLAVTLQANGAIVVAAKSQRGSVFDLAVLRYTSTGNLDNTFNGGGATPGILTIPASVADGGRMTAGIALDENQRIVVASTAHNGTDEDVLVARLTSAGVLDSSFNPSGPQPGVVMTPIGAGGDKGASIALQSDGKIVVAGSTQNGLNSDLAVLRYGSNGALDSSFGNGGIAVTPLSTQEDRGFVVRVTSGGSIVVAGESGALGVNGTGLATVARFVGFLLPTPNFTLDSDIDSALPYSSANPWTFKARLARPFPPGTRMVVEATKTPNLNTSWAPIAEMTDPGGTIQTWVVNNVLTVPTLPGVYFRTHAFTPNDETFSVVRGPYPPQVKLGTPDFTADPAIQTTSPYQNGKRWDFTVRFGDGSAPPAGFQLIVQTSSNPGNDPATDTSWTDLVELTRSTSLTWIGFSKDVPASATQHFRVIAKAPGHDAGISVVRGPYAVGAAAPVIELTVTSTRTSTYPGDTIPYEFRFKNVGGAAGTSAFMAVDDTPNTTLQSASDGGTHNSQFNTVEWLDLGTIAADGVERVFTLDLKVSNTAAPGSAITLSGAKFYTAESNYTYADPVAIPVGSPLEITCTSDKANALQTDVINFTLKVRNLGSTTATGVVVTNPLPDGGIFGRSGTGAPVFLNAEGDVMRAPVVRNPDTRKPYRNPSVAPDRKSITWYLGDLPAGAERSVRFTLNVFADADTTQPLVNRDFAVTASFGGGAAITGLGATTVSVNIGRAPADRKRPILGMNFDMTGAGSFPDPNTKTIVECVAYPTKQGSKTDVLHLTYEYYNTGDARAEFLRLRALIPKYTHLVPKGRRTVTINGKPARYTVGTQSGFSYLEVGLDYLEPGDSTSPLKLLKNKNASALVAFDVQLDPGLAPGQYILALGGELTNESERSTTYGLPAQIGAQVKKGVTYSVAPNRTVFPPDSGNDFSQLLLYRNEGGVRSSDAEMEFPIPVGAVYRDASFMTERLTEIPGRRYAPGQSIETLPAGATGSAVKSVKFHLGDVEGGDGGIARVDLREVGGSPSSGDHAKRLVSEVVIRESTPPSLRAFETRDNAPQDIRIVTESGAVYEFQFQSHLFVSMLAPASAHPNETIDYVLTWGNVGAVDNSTVQTDFYLPANTSLVSVETPGGFDYDTDPPNTFGDGSDPAGSVHFSLKVGNFENTIGKHSAYTGRVRVKVNNDPLLSGITPARFSISGADAEKQVAPPFTTIITPEGVEPSGDVLRVINENGGLTAAAAIGTTPTKNIQTKGLLNDAKLLGQDGASLTAADVGFAVAGADYIHTKSGALVIPIGGGNIVAAGGGNIVAAGGGNIVAAGGGMNGIGIPDVDVDRLSAANIAGLVNSIAKQSNIVAAGGGNIVAAGGGNILGQDAASLTYVIDNSSGAALNQVTAKIGGIIAKTGAIVAGGGGNLSPDAIRSFGATIVAAGGGNIVAAGGGNLIRDGDKIVPGLAAQKAGLVLSVGKNTMVAGSAGQLIDKNGLGIVAGGGMNSTPARPRPAK